MTTNNESSSPQVLKNMVIDLTNDKYKTDEKNRLKRYRQITSLYSKYKDNMTTIIENLHKYSSFKAYLYLLDVASDPELINLIYNTLVKIFKNDIYNYENNEKYEKISLLAKWLPRENFHFDKKINFVNKFVTIMYPNIITTIDLEILKNTDSQQKSSEIKNINKKINYAKKLYRTTCSNLNRKLGTIEPLLCKQQYNDINFNELTRTQLNKYFYTFIENTEITATNFTNYLTSLYYNLEIELPNYVAQNRIVHDIEKNICSRTWNTIKRNYYNNDIITSEPIIMDITHASLKNIKIPILLLSMFSIESGDTIFEQISYVNKNISSSTTLTIPNKISSNKILYIYTDKQIDNIFGYENYEKIIILGGDNNIQIISEITKKPFMSIASVMNVITSGFNKFF